MSGLWGQRAGERGRWSLFLDGACSAGLATLSLCQSPSPLCPMSSLYLFQLCSHRERPAPSPARSPSSRFPLSALSLGSAAPASGTVMGGVVAPGCSLGSLLGLTMPIGAGAKERRGGNENGGAGWKPGFPLPQVQPHRGLFKKKF